MTHAFVHGAGGALREARCLVSEGVGCLKVFDIISGPHRWQVCVCVCVSVSASVSVYVHIVATTVCQFMNPV